MTKHKKKNGVTKVISLKKVLANRANAKLSTGPITFEGKQKVSGNAITHALTAERLVIIGENLEEFNTFKESMLKIYEPVGAYEEEIFIKIVEIKWKLRRVTSIETGIFGNEILEFDLTVNTKLTNNSEELTAFQLEEISKQATINASRNIKILETVKTLSVLPAKPAIIAPTIITDDIALVTDINGVCKDGVTLHTT